MLKSLWHWLFGRSIQSVAGETKRFRLRGVRFVIRKVGVSSYLDGSKTALQVFDIYKVGKDDPKTNPEALKQLKQHYAHTLVAGVVSPKLTHKPEDAGVCVEELFNDWDFVVDIYSKIMEFTYGKKKMKLSISQGTS